MSDPDSLPQSEPRTLPRGDGHRVAYHASAGATPGVMFLGGFMSDMSGTKALALEAHCREAGRAFVRFDYFGHGASSGEFLDGTVGRWADDAVAILDEVADGPQVLVGSSLGGWIMLLAALARPEHVAGLVGVASAPDFTEELLWERIGAPEKEALMREGVYYEPSDYEGEAPYPITRRLIEDGRKHLVLRAPIPLTCPVRLVHGMKDRDVPYQTSVRLAAKLSGSDVTVTLIKEGDHRMSEPPLLAHVLRALDEALEAAAAETGGAAPPA